MKVLGVVLDRRLSFDSHVRTVARACNYHLQAIRHIRHLLTTELTVTLACSLTLSRLDYCNSVWHGAPTGSIQKLQRAQNTAARIVLHAPRRTHAQPLLEHLHWRTTYYRNPPPADRLQAGRTNVQSTQHWDTIIPQPSHKPKISARHLRSSSHQLLQKPTTRTHFADRAFRCTAPTVWRSLNSYTVDSGSLAVFKSRLKTFLFRRTFHPV